MSDYYQFSLQWPHKSAALAPFQNQDIAPKGQGRQGPAMASLGLDCFSR